MDWAVELASASPRITVLGAEPIAQHLRVRFRWQQDPTTYVFDVPGGGPTSVRSGVDDDRQLVLEWVDRFGLEMERGWYYWGRRTAFVGSVQLGPAVDQPAQLVEDLLRPRAAATGPDGPVDPGSLEDLLGSLPDSLAAMAGPLTAALDGGSIVGALVFAAGGSGSSAVALVGLRMVELPGAMLVQTYPHDAHPTGDVLVGLRHRLAVAALEQGVEVLVVSSAQAPSLGCAPSSGSFTAMTFTAAAPGRWSAMSGRDADAWSQPGRVRILAEADDQWRASAQSGAGMGMPWGWRAQPRPSSSPTWGDPGTPVERWFPGVPWPHALLSGVRDRLRDWQDWPSVVEPADPVALVDRLPGFQLAWLSGVRDVSVLLGLALSELAARRIITIDDAWQVSPGPLALDADPTPAFAGVLASLPSAGRGDTPPTVERLAGQVIRDAEGRSAWLAGLVRDPLLAAGLLVLPQEPGPSSRRRAHAAAVLLPPGGGGGMPTAAGAAIVDAISIRAEALDTAGATGVGDRDPERLLRLADGLGSALVCFPELWRAVQQAAPAQNTQNPRPTGLFPADLHEVMLTHDVGGALWS